VTSLSIFGDTDSTRADQPPSPLAAAAIALAVVSGCAAVAPAYRAAPAGEIVARSA